MTALSPYQKAILHEAAQGTNLAINAKAGTGKAQPLSEPILTPYGWTTMGNIHVGDNIIGIDGKAYPVIAVHPQGELDVYRVEFTDGSYVRCNSSHLWTVQTLHDRTMTRKKGVLVHRVLPLEDIYKDYLRENTKMPYKYHVPSLLSPIVQGEEVEEAYLEGHMLGNGHVGGRMMTITSPDDQFLKHTNCVPTGYFQAKGCRQYRFSWKSLPSNISRYRGTMVSGNKRLLSNLFDYSVNSRLELLRGLIDADGTNQNQDGRDRLSFSSTSADLLHLVRDLVRSLGGRACEPVWEYRDKYRTGKCGKVAFRLPFKASYRSDKTRTTLKKYNYGSAICNITLEGKEVQQCITVDAPLSLYVTRGFKLTHNSHILEHISKQTTKRCLVLAFNKHNAVEIDGKINGDCKTIHALGMGILTRFAPTKVNRNKIIPLAKMLKIPPRKRLEFETFWNAYRLSAAYPNSDHWKGVVQDFCDFNVDLYYEQAEALEEANMSLWLNDSIVDFVDMLWIPARLTNLSPVKYELVALDEAQDISPIGLDLISNITTSKTQIIVAGDSEQKIYGSLNMLHYENLEEAKRRWDCKELSLPISYRCPSEVIKEANTYVPEIQHYREGGAVESVLTLPKNIPPGSLVLSGHYANLMPEFIRRRLAGEKVALRGHNFIEECLKEAKKSAESPYEKSFSYLVGGAQERLTKKMSQCSFTIAGMEERNRLSSISDALYTMLASFTTLKEAESFAGGVNKLAGANYVFSSIHRCKGSESDNVYFLGYDDYAEESADDLDIRRLTYVGVTRSKNNLVLVR